MEISNILFSRLSNKDLMPVEITRLIKDSYYIVQQGRGFDRESVNQRLAILGWKTRILDETTYSILTFCLENRDHLTEVLPVHSRFRNRLQ